MNVFHMLRIYFQYKLKANVAACTLMEVKDPEQWETTGHQKKASTGFNVKPIMYPFHFLLMNVTN